MGTEGEVALGGGLLIPGALSSSPRDLVISNQEGLQTAAGRWALPLADLKAAGGNNGSTRVKVSTVSLRHRRYVWEIAQR